MPIGVVGIIYESRPKRQPATPPFFARKPATPPSCAAAARQFIPTSPSPMPCATVRRRPGLPADSILLIGRTDREGRPASRRRWISMWTCSSRAAVSRSSKQWSNTRRMPVIKHYHGRLHPLRGPRRRPGHGGKPHHQREDAQRPGVCNAVETHARPPRHRRLPSCPAPPTPSGRAALNCAATPAVRALLGELASSPRPTPIGPPNILDLKSGGKNRRTILDDAIETHRKPTARTTATPS